MRFISQFIPLLEGAISTDTYRHIWAPSTITLPLAAPVRDNNQRRLIVLVQTSSDAAQSEKCAV